MLLVENGRLAEFKGRTSLSAGPDSIVVVVDPRDGRGAELVRTFRERMRLWEVRAEDVAEYFSAAEVCGLARGIDERNPAVFGKMVGDVSMVALRRRAVVRVCPRCRRLLRADEASCCGEEQTQLVARATVSLTDRTGTLRFTLFGTVAEEFLGVPVCCLRIVVIDDWRLATTA